MTKRVTIGFDTSNYTTSVAVFDIDRGEIIANLKTPLRVESGEKGLRQSDALFSHIKNLPEMCEKLKDYYKISELCAVGYSGYPRDIEGSYMPCFLAGKAAAFSLASSGVPIYDFSHQAGHIMAALWHSGCRDLLKQPFLSFHVSGGTTELLYVTPKDCGFDIKLIGETEDLNAGQLVDRVGVMLGLDFPCGSSLEKLAMEFTSKNNKCRIIQKPVVKDLICNLSGAENKAKNALDNGIPKEEIAFFVLDFIARTLDKMTLNAKEKFGELPVLFAGGVMSNKYIKNYLTARHKAVFSLPEYSSDNACGTAILTAMSYSANQGEI